VTSETVPVGFWFDPICPFAWMTSRWLVEVERHRSLDIHWQVMSLSILNSGRNVDQEYQELLDRGWGPVRVVTAARVHHGDEVVKPLYDAMGTRIHPGGRSADDVITESLTEAGLPTSLAEAATTDKYDD